MFYRFRLRERDGTWSSGWIESQDGLVTEASKSWPSFVGRPVGIVLHYDLPNYQIRVSAGPAKWEDMTDFKPQQ